MKASLEGELHRKYEDLEARVASLEAVVQKPQLNSMQMVNQAVETTLDTTLSSFSSEEECDETNIDSTSQATFYIGEVMSSAEVQTDLTTSPHDVLAYATDRVSLLQAVVHNAFQDLHAGMISCQQQVSNLLEPLDTFDVATVMPCESTWDVHLEVFDYDLEQDLRLCSLRLEKVNRHWTLLSASVHADLVESDADDEFSSVFTEDVVSLCEDIGAIMGFNHTCSICTNALAAKDVHMNSFGRSEGVDAVTEFLRDLNITPCTEPCTVLTLALQMLLNNRVDSEECPRNGLSAFSCGKLFGSAF